MKSHQKYAFTGIKTYGNSMYPLLMDGDVVHYNKISFSKIKVDDLIGFSKNKHVINHRVIYKSQKFILTKGDNNTYIDSKVLKNSVIGKISHVTRNKIALVPETLYLLQSSRYFAEIISIKNKLLGEKINFVILKGLPLHFYYEKSFPRRIYADCDILVDKKQFRQIEVIFHKLGYHRAKNDLTKLHQKLKDKEPEVQFSKSISGFVVTFDIHLEAVFLMTQLGNLEALYPQKLIDGFTGKILNEKKNIKLDGESFPILSTENLIIYLALHLFHHNFTGYYRFEILKKILLKNKINYRELSNIIYQYKLNNYIYPVFILLKKSYSVKFPVIFLRDIQPNKKQLNYIQSKILSQDIYSDEPRLNSGIQRFKNIYFLSPNTTLKKYLIIFNLQFLYSLYFVLVNKVLLFYLSYYFLFKQKLNKIFQILLRFFRSSTKLFN